MTSYGVAVIGLGRMGLTADADPRVAGTFPYATHARVVEDHPRFTCVAAVDTSAHARGLARQRFPHAFVEADCAALPATTQIDVAVLATPPGDRLAQLDQLLERGGLRAVVVEKPLGLRPTDADAFAERCAAAGVMVQVNLWRRAERVCRELAAGGLVARVGLPYAAFGVYGNGVLNNGVHLIDLMRQLLGEPVTALATGPPRRSGPLSRDVDVPFALRFADGWTAAVAALPFDRYREVGLEIWAERGWLALRQEGLVLHSSPAAPHRALSDTGEIDFDAAVGVPTGASRALYDLWDNVAEALDASDSAVLWSPAAHARRAEKTVAAILRSAREGGVQVDLDAGGTPA